MVADPPKRMEMWNEMEDEVLTKRAEVQRIDTAALFHSHEQSQMLSESPSRMSICASPVSATPLEKERRKVPPTPSTPPERARKKRSRASRSGSTSSTEHVSGSASAKKPRRAHSFSNASGTNAGKSSSFQQSHRRSTAPNPPNRTSLGDPGQVYNATQIGPDGKTWYGWDPITKDWYPLDYQRVVDRDVAWGSNPYLDSTTAAAVPTGRKCRKYGPMERQKGVALAKKKQVRRSSVAVQKDHGAGFIFDDENEPGSINQARRCDSQRETQDATEMRENLHYNRGKRKASVFQACFQPLKQRAESFDDDDTEAETDVEDKRTKETTKKATRNTASDFDGDGAESSDDDFQSVQAGTIRKPRTKPVANSYLPTFDTGAYQDNDSMNMDENSPDALSPTSAGRSANDIPAQHSPVLGMSVTRTTSTSETPDFVPASESYLGLYSWPTHAQNTLESITENVDNTSPTASTTAPTERLRNLSINDENARPADPSWRDGCVDDGFSQPRAKSSRKPAPSDDLYNPYARR